MNIRTNYMLNDVLNNTGLTLAALRAKPFTSQSTWVDERVIILASLDPVEPLIWLELKITITNRNQIEPGIWLDEKR